MPITVSHIKSLTPADGTITSVVRPSDWNSAHAITVSLASNEAIGVGVAGSVFTTGVAQLNNSPTISFGATSGGSGVSVAANAIPCPMFEWPKVPGATGGQTLAAGTLYLFPFHVEAGAVNFCHIEITQSAASLLSTATATCNASNATWESSYTTGLTVATKRTLVLFSRESTGNNAASSNIVSFGSASASYALQAAISLSGRKSATNSTASWSASNTFSIIYPNVIDTLGDVTYATASFTSGSSSSTRASNTSISAFTFPLGGNFSVGIGGVRQFAAPLTGNLSQGQYWLGIIESTAATGNAISGAVSLVGATHFVATSGIINFGQTAVQASQGIKQGWGSYSASTDTAGSIALSNVSQLPFDPAFILNMEPL